MFELAERLGMPVGEMLQRMSSSELTEWMAFYDLRANPPKPVQTAREARAVLESMVVKAPSPFDRRKKR